MDWNLKAGSWDLAGFEQDGVGNVDGLSRPNNFRVNIKTSSEFSIDLKLGGVGNSLQESISKWEQPGLSKANSLPSGSMKRSRASNDGTNSVSCLVDGCNSDLSLCREYHRRHKVCEIHSKTPEVTIRGQKQRFCQQCSRFHSLEEFDEGKRSCRKRLDGHNRRRRKPQPAPMCRPGSFLSNLKGAQFLQFSGSKGCPSTNILSPAWSSIVTSSENARHCDLHQQQYVTDKQSLFLGPPSQSSYKEEKQFPFLQSNDPMLNGQTSNEASVCQPLLRNISLSETTRGRHGVFCDRLTAGVPDSDCALSLLSSTQMQTHSQTSGNPMLQATSIPMVQTIELHDHGLGAIDPVFHLSGRDSTVPCPAMFQVQSGGALDYKGPQTLPFNWE